MKVNKELLFMVLAAVLAMAVHGAVMATTGDPVFAAFATVAVATVATVAFDSFTAFTAFVVAVVAVVAVAFDSFTAFTAFTVAVALAFAAAAAAKEEYTVPMRYGVPGFGVYAMGLAAGPVLVGHYWPTAGYLAFGWYAVPCVSTVATFLLLRAGERAEKEVQSRVAAS